MKVLSSKELTALVREELPYARIIASDGLYAVPTKHYIADTFAKYFEAYKSAYGITYEPNRSDCENFSRWYKSQLELAHARSTSEEVGITVAWISYFTDSGIHHQTNMVVCGGLKGLEFIYPEPQLNEPITLSLREKASCHDCEF